MPRAPLSESLEYLEEHGLPLYATCANCGSTTLLNVGVLVHTQGGRPHLMSYDGGCVTCDVKRVVQR